MRPVEIGLVLPMGDSFVDGSTARWVDIRDLALRAEELGFDVVWTADELLWRPAGGQAAGLVGGCVRDFRRRGRDLASEGRDVGLLGAPPQPGNHGKGGRDDRRDQRRPIRVRTRVGARRSPGTRVRAARGPCVRSLRGGDRDHPPAAARGSGRLRGHIPRRPRSRTATAGPATRQDPDHDRRKGPQDAADRGSPCRHLELVRQRAERSPRVRTPACGALGGVQSRLVAIRRRSASPPASWSSPPPSAVRKTSSAFPSAAPPRRLPARSVRLAPRALRMSR